MGEKGEKPEVYAVERRYSSWNLGRRSFLAGAAATGTAVTANRSLSTGKSESEKSSRTAHVDVKQCHEVGAHTKLVSGLAFNPKESLLATSSTDQTIKLWSFPDGRLDTVLEGHEDRVLAMAASPNGKWLLSGDLSGKIRLWSFKRKKFKKLYPSHCSEVESIAITPDSKFAVSTGKSWDDNVFLWSVRRGVLLKKWGGGGERKAVAISPDGKMVAVGGGEWNADENIELWSLQSGEEGKLIRKFAAIDGMRIPEHLVFSPDGKYLVSCAGYDEYVRIWKMPSGKLKKSFKPHDSSGMSTVAINPDGKLLVTAGTGDYDKIWRFPKIKLVGTIAQGGSTDFTDAVNFLFAVQNDLLVTGYMFGAVRIWDYETCRLERCLIDIEATADTRRGRTFEYKDNKGRKVTVTVPDCACASPVPGDATCTCDTVKGKVKTGGGCGMVYYYPS